MKYPTKETIKKLTAELQLENADILTQDWECEVANVEQLQNYIEYYQEQKLNLNEKATLMRIILEVKRPFDLNISKMSRTKRCRNLYRKNE